MNLHAVVSNGRSVPVETRKPRRILSAREAAERLFKKRSCEAANVNQPRILEAAPSAMPTPPAPPAAREETEHEKVFRLVGEKKFEEAARIAARLINADDDEGFFIYGTTPDYRRAETWFRDTVKNTARAAAPLIHTITPELAQVLLLNNDGNRRVKASNLAKIMRDIMSDAWELNGEAVIVSRDGRVNDGQHRNFAALLTGMSIKSVMSFGISRESMRTVDTGEKRQAKDRLGLAGIADATRLAAITAFAFQTYEGRAPTASEADDYFHENRTLIERAVTASGSPLRGVGPSVGAVAAMHLLSIGAIEEDIRTFFKGLRTGSNLSGRSPIKKLHEGIFRAGSQIKLSRENWLRALVHHFVVWKRGRTLASVVFNQPLPKEL